MSLLAMILDLLIVVLLVATIGYAVTLNRQLSRLRDSRAELEELVRGFAEATERAEAGVQGMRRMAGESGEKLQKTVDRAQAIRDELQFMTEAADSLAARLEGAVGQGRPAHAAPQPMPAVRPVEPPLTASRLADPPRRPPEAARRPTEPPPAAHAVPPVPPTAPPGPGPAGPAAGARSRAERELLQALENRR
jgi:Domain of unknown function (DUF6468)